MTSITSFPVCKHGRRWVSRQGQMEIAVKEAATSAGRKIVLHRCILFLLIVHPICSLLRQVIVTSLLLIT